MGQTAFMQRCDTISFDIPTSEILYNTNNFEKLSVKHGEVRAREYTGEEYPGLNNIVIGEHGNTNIKVSAKILGNDYIEGINKNNIEGVFQTIKDVAGINFNNDTALQSKVRRVDLNNNVKVSGEVQDYLKAYNLIVPNPQRITKKVYKKEGFVWDRNTSTYSERFIMYDKSRDLLRGGQTGGNAKFLGIHDKQKILMSFQNVLRVEQNNQKGRHKNH